MRTRIETRSVLYCPELSGRVPTSGTYQAYQMHTMHTVDAYNIQRTCIDAYCACACIHNTYSAHTQRTLHLHTHKAGEELNLDEVGRGKGKTKPSKLNVAVVKCKQ